MKYKEIQKIMCGNPFLKQAIQLKRVGELDRALYFCHKAIEMNSNLAWGYYELGNVLSKQNTQEAIDEAVTAYHVAIQIKPESAVYYQSLGKALIKKNNIHETLAIYNYLCHLNVELAEVSYELMVFLIQNGFLTELEKSLLSNCTQKFLYRIHYNLGVACLKASMPEVAEKYFQKSAEGRSKSGRGKSELFNLIWRYLNQLEDLPRDCKYYPRQIPLQVTRKVFTNNLRKVIVFDQLTSEDSQWLSERGLSFSYLKTMSKDDLNLEEFYINNVWSNIKKIKLCQNYPTKTFHGYQSMVQTGYI